MIGKRQFIYLYFLASVNAVQRVERNVLNAIFSHSHAHQSTTKVTKLIQLSQTKQRGAYIQIFSGQTDEHAGLLFAENNHGG